MYELMRQLRDYLSGMWKYRWYGMAASWIVCLSGWAGVYFVPNKYESTAVVQVDTETVLTPLLKGLAVDTDPSRTVDMVTKRLLSRPNLERIIQATDLGLTVTDDVSMLNMVQKLQKDITIDSPKTRNYRGNANPVFNISFSHKNPKTAWMVVDRIINNLVEGTLGDNRADTTVAQKFLLEQIGEYEKRLVESEQRLAEFKKQNVGMMPGESGGYYSRMQNEIDKLQKIETDLQLAKKNRDILKKQLQKEIPLSLTRNYDKKIKEHEEKLNTLLNEYTEEHPDVQAQKSIIANLEKKKAEVLKSVDKENEDNILLESDEKLESNSVFQNVKLALKDAEVVVANLQAQHDEQQKKVLQLRKLVDTVPEVEAKLARLNRDYEVTKTQHAALLARLESARLSSEAGQSSEDVKFKIIEPPLVPIKPSSPNRLALNLAVLVIGVGAFLGITYVILQLKPVFITKDALTAATGIPVLGTVSMILDDNTKKNKRRERVVIIFLMLLLLCCCVLVVLLQRL